MKRSKLIGRVALVAIAIPSLGLAVVAIWGALLPREHTSRASQLVAAPEAEVYTALTDVRRFPEWRDEVDRVEVLDESAQSIRFREHGEHGEVTFELRRIDARRIESRMLEDDQGFGGTWTYELTPDGRSTRVTITENGYVDSVVFRFVSKYLLGHDWTQRQYLAALAARFA